MRAAQASAQNGRGLSLWANSFHGLLPFSLPLIYLPLSPPSSPSPSSPFISSSTLPQSTLFAANFPICPPPSHPSSLLCKHLGPEIAPSPPLLCQARLPCPQEERAVTLVAKRAQVQLLMAKAGTAPLCNCCPCSRWSCSWDFYF